MTPAGFETFYQQHLDRHQTPTTRTAGIIGDVLIVAGALTVLRGGRLSRGAMVSAFGFGVQLVGHALGDHNVPAEVMQALRHPLWGARADARMTAELLRHLH